MAKQRYRGGYKGRGEKLQLRGRRWFYRRSIPVELRQQLRLLSLVSLAFDCWPLISRPHGYVNSSTCPSLIPATRNPFPYKGARPVEFVWGGGVLVVVVSAEGQGGKRDRACITLPIQLRGPKIIPGLHRRTNATLCSIWAARNVADGLVRGREQCRIQNVSRGS